MTEFMRYGIDLGTTNSCIATNDGAVRIFQNNDLMNITPSAVRVMRNGRLIVGKRAYNALIEDPANVAVEFKRWMGQREQKTFPAAGRSMSPEELSAEVLKALRHDVERATGTAPTAAVITVPAAFGSLQCDATSRAASLAGFEECVLLQEPIAAAIAYGADPRARDQRWLVYDFGGGTLDIAVMSTRDGQLTVLEHRGDNLLGGKDIDNALVAACIMPALAAAFKLPDEHDDPIAFQMLLRRLLTKAEDAKIELSSAQEATVSLFDVGDDLEGTPIELEITISREALQRAFDPIFLRTVKLAGDALGAARMQGSDLSRILLVGGPTQMPYLREQLSARIGAPVDHSLDPMTVVASGAALYAASVERRIVAPADEKTPPATGALQVHLAYEPVSPTITATVAAKVASTEDGLEMRFDSQAGYWTSGWVPMQDGYVEIDTVLQEGKVCLFYLYVRNRAGNTLSTEPNEFSIRHGLVPASPPLPHTISIEVIRPNGRVELDPIFARNTPLPAEKRIQYRASHTLRPGDPGGTLAVKLWEGEEFAEPDANEWVGTVQITGPMIPLPIPEGSELDFFIQVDASRLITVEIFVPHLNAHFTDSVFLAQQEQRDESDSVAKLTREIASFIDRMRFIAEQLEERPDPGFERELAELKRRAEDLYSEVTLAIQKRSTDPDRSRRFVATGRDLRLQISGLEQRIGVNRQLVERNRQLSQTLEMALKTVEAHGDKVERFEFEMLKKAVEAAAEKLDERGVVRSIGELDKLTFRILAKQDWYWRELFESMDKSDDAFTNPGAAQRWVAQGERAVREGDGDALREAVRKLWTLQPVSMAEAGRQRAMESGIRS